MSNTNDNNSADLIADAIRFAADSKYLSTSEFYRDQHSPRYKADPVYRQACDEKLARSATQFAHVRVIDSSGGIRTAAATRNADGTIDSGITSPDAPHGNTTETTVNGLPLIKTLPGGTMQVRLSSGSTAAAKANAKTEKDAHEARLRRKQVSSSLPGKK